MDKIRAIIKWINTVHPTINASVKELPSGLIFLDLEISGLCIVAEYFFREDMLGITPFNNHKDDLDILAKSFSNPEFATENVEEAIQQIDKLIQDFQSL